MNKRLGSLFAGIIFSSMSYAGSALADESCSATSCAPPSAKAAISSKASNPCATGQELSPINQVAMYLDGYHMYKSDETRPTEEQRQIRTAHYCKQVNADMFQCLLYDGNGPDARVIGIEYVITDKLFQTLPATEQKYWHAHDTEVDSGLLVLPGLPQPKQKEILGSLRTTHGKTWQIWPDLAQKVPLGEPVLMWNVSPEKISSTTKKSVAARTVDPTF